MNNKTRIILTEMKKEVPSKVQMISHSIFVKLFQNNYEKKTWSEDEAAFEDRNWSNNETPKKQELIL